MTTPVLSLSEQYEIATTPHMSQRQLAHVFDVSRRTIGRVQNKWANICTTQPLMKSFCQTFSVLADKNTVMGDVRSEYQNGFFETLDRFVKNQYGNRYSFVMGNELLDKTLDQVVRVLVDEDDADEDIAEDDDDEPGVVFLDDEPESVTDDDPEPGVHYDAVITTSSISVTRLFGEDVDTVNISKENPNFHKAWSIVREMDDVDDKKALAKIYDLGDMRGYVQKICQGYLDIDAGTGKVYYMDFEISDKMGKRIIDEVFYRNVNDEDTKKRLVNFFERLMENPSPRSVECTFDFLQHNDIIITDDGMIEGWKYVTRDFKDCFTGTIDNSVGAEPMMPRHLVNADPNHSCSAGLHVCAFAYISGRDKTVVKVHVDPADVVCVPYDYSGAKMRCCRYNVVDVYRE